MSDERDPRPETREAIAERRLPSVWLRIAIVLGIVALAVFALAKAGGGPLAEALGLAKKPRTAEARESVKAIYDGAREYFLRNHRFPGPSVGPTPPAGSCCDFEGHRCPANAADWDDDTWKAIGFSLEGPHYFSYQYEVTQDGEHSPRFVARAIGDLDCNGKFSTFQMIGELNP